MSSEKRRPFCRGLNVLIRVSERGPENQDLFGYVI